MKGLITSSWKGTKVLHIEFVDEINTNHMSLEQLAEYAYERLFVLFTDYDTVKEPLIMAMCNASLNLDNVVCTKHLSRMLELLRLEQNISISNKVEAEINTVIEAYKRGRKCFLWMCLRVCAT